MDPLTAALISLTSLAIGWLFKAYLPGLMESASDRQEHDQEVAKEKLEREWNERDKTLNILKNIFDDILAYEREDSGKLRNILERQQRTLDTTKRRLDQIEASTRSTMGILSNWERK